MKVRIDRNSEVEISGTTVEFNALSHAVRYDGVVIPCESVFDAQSDSRFLPRMVIRHVVGQKLRFATSYDALEIVGDLMNLEVLSQVLSDFPDSLPAGYHVHVECLGEEHYISSDSLPVVLVHFNK